MSHTLKLNIYKIALKTKFSSNDELISFRDFYENNFNNETKSLDKGELYKNFSFEYFKSFNNKFLINSSETKGFVPVSDKTLFSRSQNVFDGMLKGGITGIDMEVYSRDNPEASEGKIDKDKISTLPYYFLLWTPYDSNFGILMVQSYTDNSLTAVFKEHLKDFFNKYNLTLVDNPHYPEDVKNNFLKHSNIYRVSYIKTGLSETAKTKFNPVFASYKNLKIELTVSGLNESPNDFLDRFRFKTGGFLGVNLSEIEILNNEDYETVIYYKDENGKRTHAKISNNLEITPNVILDDSLKEDGTDYPDYKKIRTFCSGVLEQLKKELKYTPNAE